MRIVLQGGLIVMLATIVRLPSAMVRGKAPDVVVPVEAAVVEDPAPDPPRTDSVVLVVLDGARWQEVLAATDPKFATGDDRGVSADALMPNLHEMIADGVLVGAPDHGPAMVASGPNFISLPGYNEIFSGRSPTACGDNECPATRLPTLVDEVRARSEDAAVFSSWAPIARAAALHPSDIVVSTGEPMTGAFRPDRATADLALAYLVEKHPTFLFMGLGEPDEYAHRGDYAGYLGSLRQADAVLGELRADLERMGERGERTSVFVTCDHGRSDDFRDHGAPWPESSRVWLVGAGGAVRVRGPVDSTRPHRLADIAPTLRVLLDLPADPSSGSKGVGSPIDELLPGE
jgi:hypothetical protein